MAETPKKPAFETICTHWAEDPERYSGAVIPPLFQNSLFTSPSCEAREQREPGSYDYTRVANPTTDILEAKLAALEHGERARCFSSGMAAISAAILSCVRAGDTIVMADTAYGPTRAFASDYLPRYGIATTFVDGRDPEDYRRALLPSTRLVYLESPSSVVMRQQDLAAVAAIARERGAATICDNSWATPYFQNPLDFGVDIVVHSATKYLGGHSDIVAGVAVGSKERMGPLVADEGLLLGAVLDPFAAWLMLRGLRTLALRMCAHEASAKELAARLLSHPAVETVYYPTAGADTQPELTRRQLRGTSGLMSIRLVNSDKATAYRFVNALRFFGIGCSWGGFESLALPMLARDKRWLVRLHIGLESCADLWCDIEDALDQSKER